MELKNEKPGASSEALERSIHRMSEQVRLDGVPAHVLETLTDKLKEIGPQEFSKWVMGPDAPSLREVPTAPDRLSDFLHADLIQGDLPVASWPPVVSEAVRLLKRTEKDLDLSLAFRTLLEAGMSEAWFPGGGLGFPHVSVKNLKESSVVVIRLRTPLPLPNPDTEPVRFLFFLFEPEESQERHLVLLSRISRLMDSAANRGLLFATTDTWALYQTLKALDDF